MRLGWMAGITSNLRVVLLRDHRADLAWSNFGKEEQLNKRLIVVYKVINCESYN